MPTPNVSHLPLMRSEAAPACRMCGSTGAIAFSGLIDHIFNVGGTFTLRRCDNTACGVLWLDPMPLEEDIHLAYSKYYTHSDDSAAFAGTKPKTLPRKIASRLRAVWSSMLDLTEQRKALYLMHLQDRKPGRVLDLGCGNGMRLARLRELGWDVQGQDVDPAAAQTASKMGIPVFVGSLQDAAFPADSFDAIVSNHVLEHLHDPAETVAECYRLLKPGGVLVIVTPNANSHALHVFARDWCGMDPPRHVIVHTLQSLQTLARAAGFGAPRVWATSVNADSFAKGSLAIRAVYNGKEDSPETSMARVALAVFYQARMLNDMRAHPEAGEECVLWAEK